MKLKFFMKPFIWLALICYGLFIPAEKIPKQTIINIPHLDKLVHFGLFFIFCLLLFRPLKKLKINYKLYAPVISLILAAILEASQHLISSSRSSNFYDFLANSAGILVSVICYHFFISGAKWEKYF